MHKKSPSSQQIHNLINLKNYEHTTRNKATQCFVPSYCVNDQIQTIPGDPDQNHMGM